MLEEEGHRNKVNITSDTEKEELKKYHALYNKKKK